MGASVSLTGGSGTTSAVTTNITDPDTIAAALSSTQTYQTASALTSLSLAGAFVWVVTIILLYGLDVMSRANSGSDLNQRSFPEPGSDLDGLKHLDFNEEDYLRHIQTKKK